jgi:hypothetical protein
MRKLMTVEMPDGSKWGVPVEMIARNRATHYASEFNNDVERSLAEDAQPLFESEEDPARLWAEIHTLRSAIQGPDGFATWKDAAVDERVRRVRAEKQAAMLGNLLAVIHRDGGQHVEKVGIEQACSDAETIVSGAIAQIEALDALIEQATLAEREACALVCEHWRSELDNRTCQAEGWAANELAELIRARSGR